MEVSGANSATQALQQQYPVARQPERREREPSAETQARPDPARNDAPQRAERNSETERSTGTGQSQEARRPESPKPVGNAQGQKTGTIINTTA